MKFSIHFDSLTEMQDALNKLSGSETVSKPEATEAKPKRGGRRKKAEAEADGSVEAPAPEAVTPASQSTKPEGNVEFEHGDLKDAKYLALTSKVPTKKRKGLPTVIAVMAEGTKGDHAWVRYMHINSKGKLWNFKDANGPMKFLSPDDLEYRHDPTQENLDFLRDLMPEDNEVE